MTRYGAVKGEVFTTYHDCGKIDAGSEAEARRIREAIAFIYGETHDVRYYPCDPPHNQHWHWTRQVQPVALCPCGRRPFHHPSAAARVARTVPTPHGLRAVAYQCPHGNHHVIVYPEGVRLRHCPDCHTVSYPERHHAQLVAAHLEQLGARTKITRCARERWHLTIHRKPQEDH